MNSAINLYLEGNFGASGGNVPPNAAGGAGGDNRRLPPSPPLSGNAGVVNEQGGGGEIDPRTFADEEMARYTLLVLLITIQTSSHVINYHCYNLTSICSAHPLPFIYFPL